MEYQLNLSLPVYFDLHSPARRGQRSLPLLIALHGYAGNKESMLRLARQIDDEELLIASVQGPFQFLVQKDGEARVRAGFCWRTDFKPDESTRLHHQILLDCIDRLVKEAGADRERVFLLAFSQAVALNYRFIYTYPDLIRGAIAVCGGVPGDLEEEGKYSPSRTDLLIITTDSDQYYPLSQSSTFKQRLTAFTDRAANVEMRVYKGGHVFPRRALPLINRWIRARL
jgi:predicted esterase